MDKRTIKVLEIIGAIVIFLGTVAAVAYGVYRLLENKKYEELDYTFCSDDTDEWEQEETTDNQ